MLNSHSLEIGIIGLDSSHCVSFTEMLNNPAHPHYVPGGRVVSAYRGGSPDLGLSRDRIDGYTQQLANEFGVDILSQPEEVAERSDAILLTSVDGRVHPAQFARIVSFGKPIYVDKPLAMSAKEAHDIAELAERHGVTWMSASSLRYAEDVSSACASELDGPIFGVDCYGPVMLEPLMPGMFWYGVHLVEMAYSVLGSGCVRVTASTNGDQDVVIGTWKDGTMATLRGNRRNNNHYGCVLHREGGTRQVRINGASKPYYASLLEQIMKMFQSGEPPIRPEEMIEVVRFMEAANASAISGTAQRL